MAKRTFSIGQIVSFTDGGIHYTGIITEVFDDVTRYKYPIRVRTGENLCDYLDQICPHYLAIEE